MMMSWQSPTSKEGNSLNYAQQHCGRKSYIVWQCFLSLSIYTVTKSQYSHIFIYDVLFDQHINNNTIWYDINGLVQGCSNFITNVPKILQFYAKPSIWVTKLIIITIYIHSDKITFQSHIHIYDVLYDQHINKIIIRHMNNFDEKCHPSGWSILSAAVAPSWPPLSLSPLAVSTTEWRWTGCQTTVLWLISVQITHRHTKKCFLKRCWDISRHSDDKIWVPYEYGWEVGWG